MIFQYLITSCSIAYNVPNHYQAALHDFCRAIVRIRFGSIKIDKVLYNQDTLTQNVQYQNQFLLDQIPANSRMILQGHLQLRQTRETETIALSTRGCCHKTHMYHHHVIVACQAGLCYSSREGEMRYIISPPVK